MVGNNDNINAMNVTPTPITTAAQPAHEHRQTQNTRANKTKFKKQRQNRKKDLLFVIHNLILVLQKAQHDKQTQEDSLLDTQKQINWLKELFQAFNNPEEQKANITSYLVGLQKEEQDLKEALQSIQVEIDKRTYELERMNYLLEPSRVLQTLQYKHNEIKENLLGLKIEQKDIKSELKKAIENQQTVNKILQNLSLKKQKINEELKTLQQIAVRSKGEEFKKVKELKKLEEVQKKLLKDRQTNRVLLRKLHLAKLTTSLQEKESVAKENEVYNAVQANTVKEETKEVNLKKELLTAYDKQKTLQEEKKVLANEREQLQRALKVAKTTSEFDVQLITTYEQKIKQISYDQTLNHKARILVHKNIERLNAQKKEVEQELQRIELLNKVEQQASDIIPKVTVKKVAKQKLQVQTKAKLKNTKVKKPQNSTEVEKKQQTKPEMKPLIIKPVGKSVQREPRVNARLGLQNKKPAVQNSTPNAQTKKPLNQNEVQNAIKRKKFEAKINKDSLAKIKQDKINTIAKRTYSTGNSLNAKFTQTLIPNIPEFKITQSSQKLHRAKYLTRSKKTVYSDHQAYFKAQLKSRLKEKQKIISNNSIRLNFKDLNKQNLLATKTLNTWDKQRVSTYDKLFYYYTVKTPMSLYAHKAFIILEMQLNASLVRMRLVPYLFLVNELCFYRIIRVNKSIINSPYYILSLYDNVTLPVALHNYMYYRNYRVQFYPKLLAKFFKQYWLHFSNWNQNKVWLLTNFLVSNITAEAVVFDYPNIVSYMSPFRRFTNLYYRNQQYTELTKGEEQYLTVSYSHTIIKLKLFSYAVYYK